MYYIPLPNSCACIEQDKIVCIEQDKIVCIEQDKIVCIEQDKIVCIDRASFTLHYYDQCPQPVVIRNDCLKYRLPFSVEPQG